MAISRLLINSLFFLWLALLACSAAVADQGGAEPEPCPGGSRYGWPMVSWEQAEVAWDGEQFIAAIHAKALVASRDGLRWKRYAEAINTTNVHDVVASPSFVILEQTKEGYFDTDRTFLKDLSNGEWRELYPPRVMWKFVPGAKEIVAFLPAGSIYSSRDGNAWDAVLERAGTRLLIFDMISVTDGGFVVLADAAIESALNWPDKGIRFVKRADEIKDAVSIASNGSGFVVVGKNGLVAFSRDGTTWAKAPVGQQLKGITLKRVVWLDEQYVAVGECGTILESEDGSQWTLFRAQQPTTFYNVASGNGVFIAIGPPAYPRGIKQFGVIYRRTYDSTWSEVVVPCKRAELSGCDPE